MRYGFSSVLLAVMLASACAEAQQASQTPQPVLSTPQPVLPAYGPLSDAEIKEAFSGKKVEWGNLGVSDYNLNGGYEYTAKGKRYPGTYVIGANRLCYDFPNGTSQCDRIMRDKDGVYMINAQGGSFRAKFLN